MKKLVFIFVAVSLLALTIVPVINLKLGTEKKGYKQWSKTVLFNLDFSLSYLNSLFYQIGISTDPNQVIIGKSDWLYLGDQYANTLTVMRRGALLEDAEAIRKIGFASDLWRQWLQTKAVKLFRVMVVPDKTSIYPEFLPGWAQPAVPSVTDRLFAKVDQDIFIDARPALRSAKTQLSQPLYYLTDTHWNSLGAWVAYRAFAHKLAAYETSLQWLSDQQVHILEANQNHGGDLAKFLSITSRLTDTEVTVEIGSERPITTEQYDYESGQLKVSGGNPELETPQQALLVKSVHALNHKKVLWLRDSFGKALAPFMAATFTEVLQLHYDKIDSVRFTQLVDTFKPDYVFITVVERNSRNQAFKYLPPSIH